MINNYSLAIKKALFYKGYSFFFLTTIIFGLFIIYFIAFTSISLIEKLPLASKDFWGDNKANFGEEKFLDPIKKQNYLANLPPNTTYFETETWQVNTFAYKKENDEKQNFETNISLVNNPSNFSPTFNFIPDHIFNFYAKIPPSSNVIQILGKPSWLNTVLDFFTPLYPDYKLDRKFFDPNKIWKFEVGTYDTDFKFVPLGNSIDIQVVALPIRNLNGTFRDSQKLQLYNLLSKYGKITREKETHILYPNNDILIAESDKNPELKIGYSVSDSFGLEKEAQNFQQLFAIIAGFLGIVNLGIIYFIFNKFLKLNTSYNQLLYILGYSRLQVVGFNALLLSIYAGISSLVAFGLALLVAKISFPSIDSIILGIFGRDFNNPYFVFELALNNTIWAWIFGINFVLFGSLFAMCYFKISKKYVVQS